MDENYGENILDRKVYMIKFGSYCRIIPEGMKAFNCSPGKFAKKN